MKKMSLAVVLLCLCLSVFSQSTTLAPEVQINGALLAAPAEKKDSAAVYGFTTTNELVLLRKGSNELICVADDPQQKGFSVACYHKGLEPFMERGRVLRKQGKLPQEIFDIREKEVKGGELLMPFQPSTLFVYTASAENYQAETGKVKDGYLRYVVYIPFATVESTGLPLKPTGAAMPWLMHPGTHGAHIMINPPAKN